MQKDFTTKKPYGIIYKATSPSGKAYIGQTVQSLSGRIGGHKQKPKGVFGTAIKKYGIDAMNWQILSEHGDNIELNNAEIAAIVLHNTLYPAGYNLTEGGLGGKMCLVSRQKLSESQKGKIITAEQRAKISATLKANGGVSYWKGKKHSAETKSKMSLAKTGKKYPKISAACKGRIVSAETRAKLSETTTGLKRNPLTAEHRKKISESWKYRVVSTETRAKMSAAMIGNKYTKGHKISAEHKAAVSAGQIKRWAAWRIKMTNNEALL